MPSLDGLLGAEVDINIFIFGFLNWEHINMELWADIFPCTWKASAG